MAQAHRVTFYRTLNVHNVKDAARRVSSTGERKQNGNGMGAKVSQHWLKNYHCVPYSACAMCFLHTQGGKSLNKPAGI